MLGVTEAVTAVTCPVHPSPRVRRVNFVSLHIKLGQIMPHQKPNRFKLKWPLGNMASNGYTFTVTKPYGVQWGLGKRTSSGLDRRGSTSEI